MATTQRISPTELQEALQGLNYPASKDDAIRKAEENGADEDAINALRSLSANTFSGPQDIAKAYGNDTEMSEDTDRS